MNPEAGSQTTPEAFVAPSCNYCGRENPEQLAFCTGCGMQLGSESSKEAQPKPKSKGWAIVLALLFGPLGLLYVRAGGTAFIMIALAIPFILTHTGGLWIPIGGRILCAFWAYFTLSVQDKTPKAKRDSLELLEQAARLEKVDHAKAIAAYEEIGKLYPNTQASREAERNIQTLKKNLTMPANG